MNFNKRSNVLEKENIIISSFSDNDILTLLIVFPTNERYKYLQYGFISAYINYILYPNAQMKSFVVVFVLLKWHYAQLRINDV